MYSRTPYRSRRVGRSMRPTRLLRLMLLDLSIYEGQLPGQNPDELPPTFWVNVCFRCREAFELRRYTDPTERKCRRRHVRMERRVLLCDKCRHGLVFANVNDYYDEHHCAFAPDGKLWALPMPSFVISSAAFGKSPLKAEDVIPMAQE